ncbi:MAG: nucleotidyltransferase substrate binding protein [Bacteroidales bacterium]
MTGKNKDIRWQQRFSNYLKALAQLNRYKEKVELNDMERQGLIKAFEFTFELAWNTLKDYLEHQGIENLVGSRDAIRQAFSNNIITDGETWMNMIESRNNTSHTYNEETANEIANEVLTKYIPLFNTLDEKLSKRIDKE